MSEVKKDNLPVAKILIDNLYKSYGPKEVLKGLNLEVYEGEMFGFIGRNGIGKSTTIDCMIGSKKYNSGRILLDGFDIKKDPLLAKQSFGYVASEPTCYEEMKGRDYLEFVANIYQLSEGDFKNNYVYLCNRLQLKLEDMANRGQQPKYHIFGHIHGSGGNSVITPETNITSINCAVLNEGYNINPDAVALLSQTFELEK